MSFISLSDLSSYLFAALQGFLCNHRLFEKAKIVGTKNGFCTCHSEYTLDMDHQKLLPFVLPFQWCASLSKEESCAAAAISSLDIFCN